MPEGNHHKHANLSRPNYGRFHHCEWALMGAPCDRLRELARELTERMSPGCRVGYVDADHGQARADDFIEAGAYVNYTDKIGYHRFDRRGALNEFDFRPQLSDCNIVLVNGNHFKATRQVVVLDPRKTESLARKLDRLDRVDIILTTAEQPQPYDFLLDHLSLVKKPPVLLPVEDVDAVAAFLEAQLAPPRLNGLVLAGGHSRRMGSDKGLLDYHGRPQREHVYDLLTPLCQKVYLSLRPDQDGETGRPVFTDTFLDLGPFGALLTAFRHDPDAAWLVVAVDLPLLDGPMLRALVDGRDHSRVATAFQNPATNFPEPLITIWEPRAYPRLLQFLSQGYSCPRKVLINSDVQVLETSEPEKLRNVNEAGEREEVLRGMKISSQPPEEQEH